MIDIDISIIEIGSSNGHILRSILETMQYGVSLHLVGQQNHFVDLLENAHKLGRIIVIAAHGDEQGILFGDFHESIDTQLLENGKFPYKLFFEKGRFKDKLVINTACLSATQNILDDFIPQQGFDYIGYSDEPDGAADLLIMHKFFYNIRNGATTDEAIESTKAVCPDAEFLVKISGN